MESIEHGTWTWHAVMHDLAEQGEYPGVSIHPGTVGANHCAGRTPSGIPFFLSWAKDSLLMVTMRVDDPDLIEAFAKVVEYRPFCRYFDRGGFPTYEWDKLNPSGRFAELQQDPDITHLESLG